MIQTGLLHIIGGDVISRTCTSCELSYDSKLKTNCMAGSGSKGAIMFLGKHPGKEDDQLGEPMTGKNGKLFYSLLLDSGFSREEVYVSNCVKCAPLSVNAGKRNWTACQQHFLAELERVQPVMIVSVGAEATEFLTERKGVSSLRTTGLSLALDGKYTVYPIRQPMMLEHCQSDADQVALRQSMVDDLVAIREIYRNGGKVVVDTVKSETDYKIARTEQDVADFFEELYAFDGPITCDLETINHEQTDGALDPRDGNISAIGFSVRPGMGRAIPLHSPGVESLFWWPDGFVDDVLVPKYIAPFLRSRNKDIYGQNWFKFDVKWTRAKWGIDFPDQKWDNLPAAYAAYHGLLSYELEVLANSLCGMPRWKREFTVKDTNALCDYLCKDVDAQVRVRAKIEEKLDASERVLLECILMPVGYELMLMEEAGTTVDPVALEALGDLLKIKEKEAMDRIQERGEVREWRYNHGEKFEAKDAQVRSILFDQMGVKGIYKTKGGQQSVDKDVMAALAEDVPLCNDIVQYRRVGKLTGTYYEGIKIRTREGRVHTSFPVHKTLTGRLVSYDPNLQTIPRADTMELAGFDEDDAAMMKDIFVPDTGFCWLSRDQSQVELRVIASLSGCTRMINMFLNNEDVHRATAAAVYGITQAEVNKAQRTAAKAVNFGIIYGMTIEGLIAKFIKARSTEQEARFFQEMHKQMFPEIWEYMKDQERIILRESQQTTYFGRTRVYEDKSAAIMRQGYNNPTQSTANDLTLLSIIRCGRELRRRKMRSTMKLTVHDSILFHTLIEEFWDVCDLSTHAMQDMSFPWLKVPLVSDAEAGPRWGSLQKIDLKNRCVVAEK